MAKNVCKITSNGAHLEFIDEGGDKLDVQIYSNGVTIVGVEAAKLGGEGDGSRQAAMLTNRAAHELRDFLNRRFPNATAVQ